MKALLLILFSGLKWGKLAASGGSMLLSLVVYATIWGWRYAAGFIALLFAHEMGHYVAARQRGLNVGEPAFIPFVGAWIALEDQPVDVETEAYVAIAGPVVGTIAALAVYLWARSENSGLLLAISYSGWCILGNSPQAGTAGIRFARPRQAIRRPQPDATPVARFSAFFSPSAASNRETSRCLQRTSGRNRGTGRRPGSRRRRLGRRRGPVHRCRSRPPPRPE